MAPNFYRSSGNLHIWNPNQPTPATPWEAEIDTLLDQGASEMDITKRPQYYWRIQQILHDQLPILETVRQQRYASWKNSLLGYQPTVWGPSPRLLQAGVDRIQGRLNIRRGAHVEISGPTTPQ